MGEQYRTQVVLRFPEAYYVYADKTFLSPKDTNIAIQRLERSSGVEVVDKFFGLQTVWTNQEGKITIYHQQPAESFLLRSQGCERDGICYPPQTWTLNVKTAEPLRLTSLQDTPAAQPLQQLFEPQRSDELLPEDLAFQTEIFTETDGRIRIHWRMADDVYLYRSSIRVEAQGYSIFSQQFSKGVAHHDAHQGDQIVYFKTADMSFLLTDPPAAGEIIQVHVEFQGCAVRGVCYPVMRRTLPAISPGGALLAAKTADKEQCNDASSKGIISQKCHVQAPAPKAQNTSTDSRAQRIGDQLDQHFFTALPLIVLMGILLSFTGCIYPMIPIVSSLVIGENTGRRRALQLLSAYVLAMAFALALVGWIFGLMEINLQVWLQKPLFILIAAAVFIALGLSMCEVFTLQLPSSLRNFAHRLSSKQESGSLGGAAAMGALSVLIVSPCATPVLAVLLLYAAQSSPLKAALALWFFGLGMGLPLLLFGSIWRELMPKQGAWMNRIKYLFAALMFGLALFMLTRLFHPFISRMAICLYFLSCALLLRPFLNGRGIIGYLRQISAWLLLFAAAFAFFSAAQMHWGPRLVDASSAPRRAVFTTVSSLEDIQQRIADTQQPVLLDFYADWCTSCQQWDQQIWNNPRFASLNDHYTLLKVDASRFDDNYRKIFRHYNLVGPPAVLFFGADKREDHARRIIGAMSPDDFSRHVQLTSPDSGLLPSI